MTSEWQSYLSNLATWYARTALPADDPKRPAEREAPPAPPSSDPFAVEPSNPAETRA
jgi:hypothetical protein